MEQQIEDIERRRKIQAIYIDQNLSPQEKFDQIKALQANHGIQFQHPSINNGIVIKNANGKENDKEDLERRRKILEIYSDSSLTPKQKYHQIDALIILQPKATNDDGRPDDPILMRTHQETLKGDSNNNNDDDDMERRRKIKAIYEDSSKSPKTKFEQIQALMQPRTILPNVKVMMMDDIERRRKIQAVYNNAYLTPKQKFEQIKILEESKSIAGMSKDDKRKEIKRIYKNTTLSATDKFRRIKVLSESIQEAKESESHHNVVEERPSRPSPPSVIETKSKRSSVASLAFNCQEEQPK